MEFRRNESYYFRSMIPSIDIFSSIRMSREWPRAPNEPMEFDDGALKKREAILLNKEKPGTLSFSFPRKPYIILNYAGVRNYAAILINFNFFPRRNMIRYSKESASFWGEKNFIKLYHTLAFVCGIWGFQWISVSIHFKIDCSHSVATHTHHTLTSHAHILHPRPTHTSYIHISYSFRN